MDTLEPLPAPSEGSTADRWTLLSWAEGVGIHRVLAAALQRDSGSSADAPLSHLDYLKQLKGREAVARVMSSAAMMDALVKMVWENVEMMQAPDPRSSHS